MSLDQFNFGQCQRSERQLPEIISILILVWLLDPLFASSRELDFHARRCNHQGKSVSNKELIFGQIHHPHFLIHLFTYFLSSMFSAPEVKIIDCKFNPTNSESFLVSTDMGVIFNESRFQNSCYPRSYQRQHSIIETPSDPVVAIDFNPFEKDVFLAAFKSDIGVIGLYHVKEDQPLVTFKLPPNNAARGAAGGATFNTLQAVRWSTHRPAVFFALTSQGKLYLWDLTETDRDPVFSADVGNLKNLGCFDMSLSPGSTQVSLVKSTSSAAAPHAQNDKAAAFKLSQNSLNNASRHASISITNENGAEIYIFDGGFSEMAVGEEETMYEYLSKFIFLGGEANKGEDDE